MNSLQASGRGRSSQLTTKVRQKKTANSKVGNSKPIDLRAGLPRRCRWLLRGDELHEQVPVHRLLTALVGRLVTGLLGLLGRLVGRGDRLGRPGAHLGQAAVIGLLVGSFGL